MKIIYNSIIPFKGWAYINLFGVLFGRNDSKVKINKFVINHESIHTLQMKYLLYVFFYLLYGIEWFIKLLISIFCKRGKYSIIKYAYMSISFEQVAYYNEKNLNYLDDTNPYEWIKYIFKMYRV